MTYGTKFDLGDKVKYYDSESNQYYEDWITGIEIKSYIGPNRCFDDFRSQAFNIDGLPVIEYKLNSGILVLEENLEKV